MNIHSRLFSPCARVISQKGDIIVNYGGLIERLLLFEGYVLQSIRLQEIPYFVWKFGLEDTIGLIKSDAFGLHYDVMQVGSLDSRTSPFPVGTYSINPFRFHFEDSLSRDLARLREHPFVSQTAYSKLEEILVPKLLCYPNGIEAELQEQVFRDLKCVTPVVRSLLKKKLEARMGHNVNMDDIELHIMIKNEVSEENANVHVNSNIYHDFGLEPREVHTLVRDVILAVGGLNLRIAQMKTHSALSGFGSEEISFFEDKLSFLLESYPSSEAQVDSFHRVLSFSDFPDLQGAASEGKIDLGRVLELQQTSEIREFRKWLWSLDSVTDAELHKRMDGFKNKVATFLHSNWGKTLRWVASSASGAITGASLVVGPLVGAFDMFLIDKVFPQRGAVAFISRMYPSIFSGA